MWVSTVMTSNLTNFVQHGVSFALPLTDAVKIRYNTKLKCLQCLLKTTAGATFYVCVIQCKYQDNIMSDSIFPYNEMTDKIQNLLHQVFNGSSDNKSFSDQLERCHTISLVAATLQDGLIMEYRVISTVLIKIIMGSFRLYIAYAATSPIVQHANFHFFS